MRSMKTKRQERKLKTPKQTKQMISPKSKSRLRNRKYRQNLTPRRKGKQQASNSKTQRKIRSDKVHENVAKRPLFQVQNICKKLSEGPIYVCTICYKLLYRKSVKPFNRQRYTSLPDLLQEKVFRTDLVYRSVDDSVWICNTCDSNLRSKKVPVQAKANGLEIDNIPEVLKDLNSLESRLIAKRIPFLKLLMLPRGRQKAINGPVVNVPTKLDKVCDVLPRLPSDAKLLGLKLKRKLVYKGHYMHQFIRPTKIKAALSWLKIHNKLYFGTDYNDHWEEDWAREDAELWQNLTYHEENEHDIAISPRAGPSFEEASSSEETISNQNQGISARSDMQTEAAEEEVDEDEQVALNISTELRGLPYSTLLQPDNAVDIFNDTVSVAPSEGERPIPILRDKNFEALAFPALFPRGIGTFENKRDVEIPLRRYFNQRILDVDGRFAKDIDYILTAQYMVEQNQVMSDISVMMRQQLLLLKTRQMLTLLFEKIRLTDA